jgi:hypothetical protein
MNIEESYKYIPVSPLAYAKQIKSILNTGLTLEEMAERSDLILNYIKYSYIIHQSYAERIMRFMKINKLSQEETIKILKLTKEQFDDYMFLLN